MIIFLIKLIAAPLLLALATLAARRWGTVLGGILIGLPLISGPISVFLAIENGAGFAVETARGALAGTVALAVFTCVYAAVCPKGWLKASFLSVALYVLASWIAAELPISAVTLAVSAAAAIVLSLWIMPVPHSAAVKRRPPKHDLLMRMGMMTALAIGIHNFPEGIATFTSAVDNMALGVAIAVAIAIHNIPEGIAVSIPIYYATGDRRKAFRLSLLSGLAEPVGAVLAYLVLTPFMTPTLMGCILAGVAGIMVFISIDELLPAAREYGEAHISIYGVVAGMALMAVSLILLA